MSASVQPKLEKETSFEKGKRWAVMLLFTAIAVLTVFAPIKTLINSRHDYYSHIVLVPLITAYFIFIRRKRIAAIAGYALKEGACVVVIGMLLYGVGLWHREWLGTNDFASLAAAGAVVVMWGAFLLVFGRQAFTVARFPLFFLLFAVPIPLRLLEALIHILQIGSVEVVQWLFDISGTVYYREGFVYQLPGINIEVAKECSGIRSTIALIISCVLAGRLFLTSTRRQVVLLITVLPITILKNAVRILTLSLLSIHVDPKFITDGWLHHSGGIVFYIPALGLLGLVLTWLRRGERRAERGSE
jgi:exosortase